MCILNKYYIKLYFVNILKIYDIKLGFLNLLYTYSLHMFSEFYFYNTTYKCVICYIIL